MKISYPTPMKFLFLVCTSIFLLSCAVVKNTGEPSGPDSVPQIEYFNKPDWIFFLDFSDSPTGVYTRDALIREWSTRWSIGIEQGRIEIEEDPASPFGKSLKVSYPEGFTGPRLGGADWRLVFDNSYEELYCSYSVKFSKSFDFVLGGKLPGLTGGKGNTGGNPPDGYDGWSARMMWLSYGDIVQYVYHPDQRTRWGDNLPWSKNFWSQHSFIPGKWYTVEHRIKMNTPKKFDGEIEGWLNGKLALRETDLRFRFTDAFGIDSFSFTTFFGGSGSRWAPVKNESILFDNFIISTSPITH